MRLLKSKDNGDFSLIKFGVDNEEVTFKDIIKGTGKSKASYIKIRFCEKQATKNEAINSIFRLYQDAAKCYIYLSDVLDNGSVRENQFS
ncbi:heterokaryon incompatibility [Cenococcum geophilum]